MIGLQSLWTGTPQFRLTRGTMLIHTLAACLADKAFPQIELVTDARGYQIAETLGWRYAVYAKALDNFAPARMAHIWALGKLFAIGLQTRPFCHLDNDVLLLKPLPLRIRNARIFAQNKDRLGYYMGDKMDRAIQSSSLIAKIFEPFNTGIIGGTDGALLSEYAKQSIAAAARLSPEIDGTTASMVCEQSWLGQFARGKKVEVETLLNVDRMEADANELGYIHLLGQSKHEAHYQQRAEVRLIRDFPADYARFNLGWTKLAKLEKIAA